MAWLMNGLIHKEFEMSKKNIGVALFSLVFVILGGCSTKTVCPQKPWFPIYGGLVWVESADIDSAYEAVLTGLKELEFTISEKGKDGLAGKVEARTFEGEAIVIKLQAETDEWTRLSIHVKSFNNKKKKAKVVYEKIKEVMQR